MDLGFYNHNLRYFNVAVFFFETHITIISQKKEALGIQKRSRTTFFSLHFILRNYFIILYTTCLEQPLQLAGCALIYFSNKNFEINKVVVVFYLPRNLGGYTIEIAPEFER